MTSSFGERFVRARSSRRLVQVCWSPYAAMRWCRWVHRRRSASDRDAMRVQRGRQPPCGFIEASEQRGERHPDSCWGPTADRRWAHHMKAPPDVRDACSTDLQQCPGVDRLVGEPAHKNMPPSTEVSCSSSPGGGRVHGATPRPGARRSGQSWRPGAVRRLAVSSASAGVRQRDVCRSTACSRRRPNRPTNRQYRPSDAQPRRQDLRRAANQDHVVCASADRASREGAGPEAQLAVRVVLDDREPVRRAARAVVAALERQGGTRRVGEVGDDVARRGPQAGDQPLLELAGVSPSVSPGTGSTTCICAEAWSAPTYEGDSTTTTSTGSIRQRAPGRVPAANRSSPRRCAHGCRSLRQQLAQLAHASVAVLQRAGHTAGAVEDGSSASRSSTNGNDDAAGSPRPARDAGAVSRSRSVRERRGRGAV